MRANVGGCENAIANEVESDFFILEHDAHPSTRFEFISSARQHEDALFLIAIGVIERMASLMEKLFVDAVAFVAHRPYQVSCSPALKPFSVLTIGVRDDSGSCSKNRSHFSSYILGMSAFFSSSVVRGKLS